MSCAELLKDHTRTRTVGRIQMRRSLHCAYHQAIISGSRQAPFGKGERTIVDLAGVIGMLSFTYFHLHTRLTKRDEDNERGRASPTRSVESHTFQEFNDLAINSYEYGGTEGGLRRRLPSDH